MLLSVCLWSTTGSFSFTIRKFKFVFCTKDPIGFDPFVVVESPLLWASLMRDGPEELNFKFELWAVELSLIRGELMRAFVWIEWNISESSSFKFSELVDLYSSDTLSFLMVMVFFAIACLLTTTPLLPLMSPSLDLLNRRLSPYSLRAYTFKEYLRALKYV